MPRMDNDDSGRLSRARLLLIADGKYGKSYYAGMAGAHFNVLYLDGDVAAETIQQLPAAVRRNIYLLSVGDTIDSGRIDHNNADFLTSFFTESTLLWDDTRQKLVSRKDDLSESEVWEIKPAKMDNNTVLVIDSWTTAVMSLMQWAADAEGVDLMDTDSPEMRPIYAAGGNKATQWLRIIEALPCHVIVVAHPDEFVKQEKPTGRVKDAKEGDMKVLWTKMVPKSTSKPHSLTMAKFFTDVAWLEASPTGTTRYINFRISDERISGGHYNDRIEMEKRWFHDLVKQLGGIVPDKAPEPSEWLTMYAKGEWRPPEPKVLAAGKDSKMDVKPVAKTMASLTAVKGFPKKQTS